MAHVTPAVWGPAEAALGRPAERTWTYEIGAAEMDMVVSSTRGQTRLHDVTVFIFGAGGALALIKKHNYPPGAWRAPGGGINPGEEFVAGARREAREETGLDVRLTRYLLRVHVTFTCSGRSQPWTTHVVLAEAGAGAELAVCDPKEIAGAKWGSLDELCGPIAEVLLGSGRGLFRYRVALHREVADLLKNKNGAGV